MFSIHEAWVEIHAIHTTERRMPPFLRIQRQSPFITPSRQLGRVIRQNGERSASCGEIAVDGVDCVKINHSLTMRVLVGLDVNDFAHVYLVAVETNLIESHVFSQLLQTSWGEEKQVVSVV